MPDAVRGCHAQTEPSGLARDTVIVVRIQLGGQVQRLFEKLSGVERDVLGQVVGALAQPFLADVADPVEPVENAAGVVEPHIAIGHAVVGEIAFAERR